MPPLGVPLLMAGSFLPSDALLAEATCPSSPLVNGKRREYAVNQITPPPVKMHSFFEPHHKRCSQLALSAWADLERRRPQWQRMEPCVDGAAPLTTGVESSRNTKDERENPRVALRDYSKKAILFGGLMKPFR
jgi:hypothetical protein